MQDLIVSSQTLWHSMHAATQSCISLLIVDMLSAWVMAPPGGCGNPGRAPCSSVLRPCLARRHRADTNNPPRNAPAAVRQNPPERIGGLGRRRSDRLRQVARHDDALHLI